MEQIYIGFQSNHLTQLKLLADANWWMLPFEGELWLVKGKAVSESEEKGDYALLVSDMREVWIGFPSMDLSEEANKFNPNIQGELAGVMNILNGVVEKFDSEARYEIYMKNPDVCEFEISKLMNNIFKFRWVITGNKLPAHCAKKLLFDYFISPLIRTLNIQEKRLDQLDASANIKTPRNLTELRRLAHEKKTLNTIELSTSSSVLMSEFSNIKIQALEEESRMQELNRKRTAPQDIEKLNSKRPKMQTPNVTVDYEESKEERLRKLELEKRLKGKQQKSKLDFL